MNTIKLPEHKRRAVKTYHSTVNQLSKVRENLDQLLGLANDDEFHVPWNKHSLNSTFSMFLKELRTFTHFSVHVPKKLLD
jgi:hypothetical protein